MKQLKMSKNLVCHCVCLALILASAIAFVVTNCVPRMGIANWGWLLGGMLTSMALIAAAYLTTPKTGLPILTKAASFIALVVLSITISFLIDGRANTAGSYFTYDSANAIAGRAVISAIVCGVFCLAGVISLIVSAFLPEKENVK